MMASCGSPCLFNERHWPKGGKQGQKIHTVAGSEPSRIGRRETSGDVPAPDHGRGNQRSHRGKWLVVDVNSWPLLPIEQAGGL
jgi:hypothetical protein